MAFLLAPFQSAWQHRKLLRELSNREISTSFKGSFLGFGWLVLQPLATLSVYALVFAGIFETGDGMAFVSRLFMGMIVLQAFSEPVSRAARLVLSKPNYVTKVVFPLDVLPWPVLALATVHATTSTAMLLILHTVFVAVPDWTAIALPLVIAPVLLLGLSVSWVVSSIGVYVRDTHEVVRVALHLLFFLSPIVWELSRLKNEVAQQLVMLNPLAIAMEAGRALIDNSRQAPAIGSIIGLFIGSLTFAALGHAFFCRTKDGFADVL